MAASTPHGDGGGKPKAQATETLQLVLQSQRAQPAARRGQGGGGAQQPRPVERAGAALQVHSRDLHFGGVSTFTQESTCACEAAAAADLLTSGVARGATHTRRQG